MGQRLVWENEDDQIGAKNTESDGPTPRGKDSSSEDVNSHLISSRSLGAFLGAPPFLWEISDVIYHFLWSILFLHLLVIHAHT